MSLLLSRLSSRRAAALIFAGLISGAMPGRAADPVVSHPAAAQRAGTKLVDITCDLAADAAVAVTLQISRDGGALLRCPQPR